MAVKAAWGALQTFSPDRNMKGFEAKGISFCKQTESTIQGRIHAADRASMQGWGWNIQKFAGNEVNHIVNCEEQRRFALRERRLALEKDVEQLQKKLTRETNVRRALEAAFRRPIGTLPRLPHYLPPKTQELLAEVAVLEEEVVHLEDRVLSLQHDLSGELLIKSELDKHVNKSRPTKPNSIKRPGEGVGQKKNLIVARLLGPSPTQTPVTAEQATLCNKENENSAKFLTKSGSKQLPDHRPGIRCKLEKQDSCKLERQSSSRSKGGLQERKTPQAEQIDSGKENKRQKLLKLWPKSTRSEQNRGDRPLASSGNKTFNSNGNQGRNCESGSIGPNKLSEELIKCLLNIYSALATPHHGADFDASSNISRSTFSSFSSNASKSSYSIKTVSDFCLERDPYTVCRDPGPYRHYKDVSVENLDSNKVPFCSSLFKKLRMLVAKLAKVELQGMTHKQKLAFWINIYNSCMMHAFLEQGIPGTPQQMASLMEKAKLNVGGYILNTLAIEHFVLGLPSHSKHAFAKVSSKEGEHLQCTLGVEWPEPLVSFALSCGTWSSPAVRVYTPAGIENELQTAMNEYLQAAIGLRRADKLSIPRILEANLHHFAKDEASMVAWLGEHLPCHLREMVDNCMKKANGFALEVLPYCFKFRYLLTL